MGKYVPTMSNKGNLILCHVVNLGSKIATVKEHSIKNNKVFFKGKYFTNGRKWAT